MIPKTIVSKNQQQKKIIKINFKKFQNQVKHAIIYHLQLFVFRIGTCLKTKDRRRRVLCV